MMSFPKLFYPPDTLCLSACLSFSLTHACTHTYKCTCSYFSICRIQNLSKSTPYSTSSKKPSLLVCARPPPHTSQVPLFHAGVELNPAQLQYFTDRVIGSQVTLGKRKVGDPLFPSPTPLLESRIHVGLSQAVGKVKSQETLFLEAGEKTIFSQWFQKEGVFMHSPTSHLPFMLSPRFKTEGTIVFR